MRSDMAAYVSRGSGKQRGLTLIEVLIAVVILAIGLLGVAGVQVVSLQQTNNAQIRTLANLHAQDVAEMLRMNAGQALPAAQMTALNERVKSSLGTEDATVTVTLQGSLATVTVSWVESVPVSQSSTGRKTETLQVLARVGPR